METTTPDPMVHTPALSQAIAYPGFLWTTPLRFVLPPGSVMSLDFSRRRYQIAMRSLASIHA